MIFRPPVVVLDACVLYPAALRSLMMWLAVHEMIRPKWSEQIHDEWMRNVLRDRPDLSREKLERTRRLMDEHAGDCLVSGFARHLSGITLPDPDDRHVLAAAIEAGADAVVTWNLSDFPQAVAAAYGIEIQTPDQLLDDLLAQNEERVLAAMRDHRASLKNPARPPEDYVQNLLQQGLKTSCARLLRFLEKI